MKPFFTTFFCLIALTIFLLNISCNTTANSDSTLSTQQEKAMNNNKQSRDGLQTKVIKAIGTNLMNATKSANANSATTYDFEHFLLFDSNNWEKIAEKKDEGEGDAWGTIYRYKKDNLTLELYDGNSSYGYFQNYKLFDKENELMRERDFSYSDGYMSETVKDYMTHKQYTREEERSVKYDLWATKNKPLMASGEWTISTIEMETGSSPATNEAAIAKIEKTTNSWNTLKNAYEPNRDRDGTWLDVGLRAKYAMLKQYTSLPMLEKAFGKPVFSSGPHKGDMNFNDAHNFGHYNSKFISQLRTSMKSALSNPVLRKAIKQIYTKDLESMARTYHEAYRYVNDGNVIDFQKEYKKIINSNSSDGSMQEFFRDYADNGYYADAAEAAEAQRTNPNRDWYEAVTAPAFWVRRSLDGTDKQLFSLLDMVIKEMEN